MVISSKATRSLQTRAPCRSMVQGDSVLSIGRSLLRCHTDKFTMPSTLAARATAVFIMIARRPTDVGMPHALAGAGAAQRDLVQQGHVVAHHSCLADDYARRMIHEDSPAYLGCWVNVHVQNL